MDLEKCRKILFSLSISCGEVSKKCLIIWVILNLIGLLLTGGVYFLDKKIGGKKEKENFNKRIIKDRKNGFKRNDDA